MTVTLMDVPALMGPAVATRTGFLVGLADRTDLDAYRRMRRETFVAEQGIFTGSDRDDLDDDPRTLVLVARAPDGTALGGVRIAPATSPDLGWWTGSRLVVAAGSRARAGVGSALVRAACALAEERGALRFDATVQRRVSGLFTRLGWRTVGETVIGSVEHLEMRWPIDRFQRQVDATKAPLAALLDAPGGTATGVPGFLGDDGVPVPGSDLVAACDAILPSMVERDPEWAGWCGVLVNVNDLTAMGAEPVGLLDAVAGPDLRHVGRVLDGLRRGAAAWGIPILGGHTQLGAPAALGVTALGRTSDPIPGGGGRIGHTLSVTADLGGSWRQGHTGTQWNSTESRGHDELQALARTVADARPAAAKDVSMAGLVGTVGMLAEASGCGAVLDVDRVPTPAAASTADWFACFPGFAVITADDPGRSRMSSPVAATAECGELVEQRGVLLRWPDGETTDAVGPAVTGLGAASGRLIGAGVAR